MFCKQTLYIIFPWKFSLIDWKNYFNACYYAHTTQKQSYWLKPYINLKKIGSSSCNIRLQINVMFSEKSLLLQQYFCLPKWLGHIVLLRSFCHSVRVVFQNFCYLDFQHHVFFYRYIDNSKVQVQFTQYIIYYH